MGQADRDQVEECECKVEYGTQTCVQKKKKKQEETEGIKLKEDTNVGNASVKNFESSFFLSQIEDSYKYSNVREYDKDYVKLQYNENHKETIDLVDSNIFCCQLHNGHVFAV